MAKEKDDERLSRIAYDVQNYQQQAQFMQQQLTSIQATLNEIGAAVGTLGNLDKVQDNNVILPLGAGTHINAKVTDTKNVLVNIGSEVITEKPVQEAVSILEERRKRLESTRDKLQEGLLQISQRLQQLDSEVKRIVEKK